MSESDPRLRPEVIVEAPFDRPDQIGQLAMSGVLLDDQYPDLFDSFNLMASIQSELPHIEIKDEQIDCLDAIQEARVMGQDRGLVHMATGLGKTTVVAADVKRYLSEKPDAKVLFLCHQNDILGQARDRFEEIVGPDFTYGDFTGEAQDYHEVSCLFASFQAMRGWRDAFMPDDFDYIIVDESHHAMANTYKPTLEHFTPKFLLGVTATPDRLDLRDIREIFGDEIYSLPLEEAIAEALLAEVDYRVITDEIEEERVLRDDRGKRLSINQLNRTIFVPKRDEEIVRIITEHSAEIDNPKRIIFCNSIEHAEELAQYFTTAAPLHTRMPHWEQDKYIAQFKAGELDTILAVNMFNEGIDVPDANQIVFLRSTLSKTIFLQQLGRGLRKIEGKEHVQVLDFVANCERLAMIDEVWREILSYQEGSDRETPDLIRVNVGGIQFNEVARRVLDILDEIEANKKIYSAWSAEDSKSYYRMLSDEYGRPASVSEIGEAHADPGLKGPPLRVLTREFGHSLKALQRACGMPARDSYPDWSSEDTIALYNELSQGRVIGITELRRIIKDNKDMPGLSTFLRPFGGRLTNLHLAVGQQPNRPDFAPGYIGPVKKKSGTTYLDWSAGDSVRIYQELVAGRKEKRLGKTVLMQLLADRDDTPGLMRFLKPFNGNFTALEEELGNTPSQSSWEDWDAETALTAYADLVVNSNGGLTARKLTTLLQDRKDLPSIPVFLRPFSGSINALNEYARQDPIVGPLLKRLERESPPKQRKEATPREDWTADDSIQVFRDLSGEDPLDVTELERVLREDHPELPSIRVLLKPFKGRFGSLAIAAGYEERKNYTMPNRETDLTAEQALAAYQAISAGRAMKARELEEALKGRNDLPSIAGILKPFNGRISVLNAAAGYGPQSS